jgi:hypothetical protein
MALIQRNREPTPNELKVFGLLLAPFFGMICSMGWGVMGDPDDVLDYCCALGDAVSLRVVHQAADVYGVDGCDAPNWLGHQSLAVGGCLLWLDHACRAANAAVWIRPDATPTEPENWIILDKTRACQQCQPILQTILTR